MTGASVSSTSRWFTRPLAESTGDDRRLSLGFAPPGFGGNHWLRIGDHLPDTVVAGVRLPGRENRLGEAAVTDRDELVSLLEEALRAESPVALEQLEALEIIGICLSSKLALALAVQLAASCPDVPVQVLLLQPNLMQPEEPANWLTAPRQELRSLIAAQLGRSDLLANDAVFDLFAPMIRADFHLAHAWPSPTPGPVLPQVYTAVSATTPHDERGLVMASWDGLQARVEIGETAEDIVYSAPASARALRQLFEITRTST